MKAKLTVNGKEFEVDISDEQAKVLTEKKTGFERVIRDEVYFPLVVSNNAIANNVDTYSRYDTDFFLNGQYFNDEKLRNDYIRALKLFLKLSQWQALNDEPIINSWWWSIGMDNMYNKLIPMECCINGFMIVRFSTKSKAEKAIEAFRSDLEWYFTKFKPRLDM